MSVPRDNSLAFQAAHTSLEQNISQQFKDLAYKYKKEALIATIAAVAAVAISIFACVALAISLIGATTLSAGLLSASFGASFGVSIGGVAIWQAVERFKISANLRKMAENVLPYLTSGGNLNRSAMLADLNKGLWSPFPVGIDNNFY